MSTIDSAERSSQVGAAANPEPSESRHARQRRAERKRLLGSIPLHLTLTAIGFTLFVPFLWMILTSLKPLDQIGADNWLPTLSANTDAGQSSEDAVEAVRQTVAAGQTPTARFLQDYVDTEAESVTPRQLADMLNAAIQNGAPLPAEAYTGVELSPHTRARLVAVKADAASPIDENLTGPAEAYAPAGSLRRAQPVERSDYEAWVPE